MQERCFWEHKESYRDFDAEHSTDYYDDIREISDILDDDDVDYWLKAAAKDGVDRVRCFVADTYSDDIYKLDGYNNLANVTDGDLESLVYDLTEKIKDDIENLKASELWWGGFDIILFISIILFGIKKFCMSKIWVW